jgi:ectoine hydroxylase-related dioxygenase (phytanoyl-CoA dioxygenase family)
MNEIKDSYINQGYFLVRSLLSYQDLESIEEQVRLSISRHWRVITDLNDPVWVGYAVENPACVTRVYDDMRDHDLFIRLGLLPKIVDIVSMLINQPKLYKKIPFRIDVPFETKELAFWHQDDFYVKGNDEELTVWIPLFDTKVQQGCLQVMPKSHTHGKIPHTLKIGKKTLPASAYENEIRYVEMNRGDALFFSSYLLHSSSLNISDEIRYSIQLRYSCGLKEQSNEMKGTVNV